MNINITLDSDFERKFHQLMEKYGVELAKINGLSDSQVSHTDFIDNFIDTKTVADASIDGNSNVGHKDIVTLINEMPKPHQKILAFNKIYYEMKKAFGVEMADKWLEHEWVGFLYMHDANTSTFVHYCFAYDLKDLAEKGLFFIGENFNAEPPRHLETFVDFVKEYVSWTCNRSSGAVGLPNLLPYMYYFWKLDVDSNWCSDGDRYARQQFQRKYQCV
jgi:ribonucleoside-triphosphate reductase